MKICFWIGNAYYRKAGTNKIVCTIANELIKNHDVSILIPISETRENVFEYDKRIKIEKIQDAGFVYNQPTRNLTDLINETIRNINNKTGFFNNSKRYKTMKKAFYPEKYTSSLKAFFQNRNYDVIVATGSEILWLAMLAESLSPNMKLIGWQHSSYDSYLMRENALFWNKEELLKQYIPKLDKLIVLNPYDEITYFQKLGIKVGFIENPLTIKYEIKTNPNNKQFIYVGRLSKEKGVELLIDSFAFFCQHNDEWELVIVGDGKLRNRLIKQVWERNVQARVHFVGFKTDVLKYYLESSIFLMTSRYEGWGLVVTEAMQLGLPVISYDITPMEYIIDHTENGLIVGQFHTKRYAVAMLKLAKDYDMRQKMSKSAVLKSECFSLDVIINKWIELFS